MSASKGKTGDSKLEEAYSLHFVWPGKAPFHAPRADPKPGPDGATSDPAASPAADPG